MFNKSEVDFTLNEKGDKKTKYIFVTSHCGLLYFTNFDTRQVDKIIQIHEDKITTLIVSPERSFVVTGSINGILRIWSPDFTKLISEVNTQQPVLDCAVSQN
jgi:WD40 repeat protein